jgi:adenylate cyclase
MIEREKRWKLKSDPPSSQIKDKFTISQTYANFSPDVRVRKITDSNNQDTYYHTVKYQLKDNIREELEHRISKERYDRIFEVINKKPIIKERSLVDLDNGLIAEIDCFLDTGDKIIEVEFLTEESMNVFVAPDWFGEELEENKSFSIEVFSRINKIKFSLWGDL